MNILTTEERKELQAGHYNSPAQFFDAIEAAVIKALAAGVSVEPESFETWNAKQHGDPEEIGFLQALRIAYCHGQESMRPAIAAARVQAIEECIEAARGVLRDTASHLSYQGCGEVQIAIRALLGKEAT